MRSFKLYIFVVGKFQNNSCLNFQPRDDTTQKNELPDDREIKYQTKTFALVERANQYIF